MTRQWLAHPDKMCKSHLLGEHFEAHLFLEKMNKGMSLDGFYEKGLFFGADYVVGRHNLLSQYIENHTSLISMTEEIREKYPLIMPTVEHIKHSVIDLMSRCSHCRANYRN